jgi:CoA:oxalate CoA-transferase
VKFRRRISGADKKTLYHKNFLGTKSMANAGPLSGITILDFSRVLAGPFCTMMLSELGARVIKIEPPGTGDDSREYGPFIEGRSAYFVSVNRGKESVVIDLKDPNERPFLEALLAEADVLTENFRPGVMDKLGLGWDQLHPLYPKLVYASISGFGQTGPLAQFPAYDMVVQGMSGLMSITGFPGQPPARVGVSIGDIAASLHAAIAINAALYHRAATGVATRIDVAMFDCQLSLLDAPITRYSVTGEVPGPAGSRHPTITPFQPFATADTPIIIAAGNDSLFAKAARAVGLPGMIDDPRFASNELRTQNVEALTAAFESVLTAQSCAHWVSEFERTGVPHALINSLDQVFKLPQVAARNMIVTVEDKVAGPVRVSGNPLKFSGFDDPVTRPSAPELNGDRNRILEELGLSHLKA